MTFKRLFFHISSYFSPKPVGKDINTKEKKMNWVSSWASHLLTYLFYLIMISVICKTAILFLPINVLTYMINGLYAYSGAKKYFWSATGTHQQWCILGSLGVSGLIKLTAKINLYNKNLKHATYSSKTKVSKKPLFKKYLSSAIKKKKKKSRYSTVHNKDTFKNEPGLHISAIQTLVRKKNLLIKPSHTHKQTQNLTFIHYTTHVLYLHYSSAFSTAAISARRAKLGWWHNG